MKDYTIEFNVRLVVSSHFPVNSCDLMSAVTELLWQYSKDSQSKIVGGMDGIAIDIDVKELVVTP